MLFQVGGTAYGMSRLQQMPHLKQMPCIDGKNRMVSAFCVGQILDRICFLILHSHPESTGIVPNMMDRRITILDPFRHRL